MRVFDKKHKKSKASAGGLGYAIRLFGRLLLVSEEMTLPACTDCSILFFCLSISFFSASTQKRRPKAPNAFPMAIMPFNCFIRRLKDSEQAVMNAPCRLETVSGVPFPLWSDMHSFLLFSLNPPVRWNKLLCCN